MGMVPTSEGPELIGLETAVKQLLQGGTEEKIAHDTVPLFLTTFLDRIQEKTGAQLLDHEFDALLSATCERLKAKCAEDPEFGEKLAAMGLMNLLSVTSKTALQKLAYLEGK